MAQPYSNDLRVKMLEAYEAGAGSLRELASQFRVSWGYSKKIRAHQVRTGEKVRPVQLRHGPVSRISEAEREKLRTWLSTFLRVKLDGVNVFVFDDGDEFGAVTATGDYT